MIPCRVPLLSDLSCAAGYQAPTLTLCQNAAPGEAGVESPHSASELRGNRSTRSEAGTKERVWDAVLPVAATQDAGGVGGVSAGTPISALESRVVTPPAAGERAGMLCGCGAPARPRMRVVLLNVTVPGVRKR